MPLQYKKIYDCIVKEIRFKGYKVYHRKQSNGTGGTYDPTTCHIEIDPSVKWKLEGIFVLCHEYEHLMQHRNGEHPGFFKGYKKYSEKAIEEIEKAEQEASKRAIRRMKTYGLKYMSDDLDPSQKEVMRAFWQKYYF